VWSVQVGGGGGGRLLRHSVHFDLDDNVYVGGVPAHMYRLAAKSLLVARDGFHGCLASLRLNGPVRHLLDGSFQLPPHSASYITPGCDGALRWSFRYTETIGTLAKIGV